MNEIPELQRDSDLIILVSEQVSLSTNENSRIVGTITHIDKVMYGKSYLKDIYIRFLGLNGEYVRCSDWEQFRLATKTECLWYHLGIRNINNVKQSIEDEL